jgi:hypothetical protein
MVINLFFFVNDASEQMKDINNIMLHTWHTKIYFYVNDASEQMKDIK